ncbi:MAG: DUF45 domain-containing protein, partial [Clostridia bacterium]|nr:DUF45 domain-containing protein [Clostridia bacterium]
MKGGRISSRGDVLMKYEIVRSNRRTVAISIKNGKVILRAPLNLKDPDAEKIIKKHEKWILS